MRARECDEGAGKERMGKLRTNPGSQVRTRMNDPRTTGCEGTRHAMRRDETK